MAKQLVLAGDIGGSKTTLALLDTKNTLHKQTTYQNAEFSGIKAILGNFLGHEKELPNRGCLGVAGPVHNNHTRLTNLDWNIDAEQLCAIFGLQSLLLVNDLVATAAGVNHLPPEGFNIINSGTPVPDGVCAVLAAGTGLGQAFTITADHQRHILPSEGGHASFAPRNEQQVALLRFMHQTHPHVSVEAVCSGKAIPSLYAFICQSCPAPRWLSRQLEHTDNKTRCIVQAANDAQSGGRSCEPARKTLELFIDILAAEAANLALKVLATGGVYIGGGLPPRVLSFFDTQCFMQIFCRGIYRELLATIPVQLLLASDTAVIGAYHLALK